MRVLIGLSVFLLIYSTSLEVAGENFLTINYHLLFQFKESASLSG